MDFWIGSGLAALKDIGNEAEDLHFHGGQYGIVTERPSPGWQFTLIDSSFEGQSKAAIQEHEAGLTLIHDTFRNVPHAVSIDPGYSEELWVARSQFQDISGPAIEFGRENNARTEINLEDIACSRVKVFAQMRETGKTTNGPGESYVVKRFSHGLTLRNAKDWGSIETVFDAHAVSELPSQNRDAIAALPPITTWVNLKSLGVNGDGETDDTAAIQKAIDAHATIYVPMGRYLVTDTIRLRPDTVLIGLHPSMTQFDLKDESPGFQGVGAPRALLETPKGGHNIVTGIGLFTGGINDRAVGALWRAGADSLMDDVRFLGGHGTNAANGSRLNPYNSTHTGDPNPRYKWDAQYPSLWVTDGGGGTFANIWTPSTFAEAGLLISNTSTPGFVYELSSEHHVRNEIKLDGAENWELDALQTEEERGESGDALPIEIDRSRNITLANYHGYRVISSYEPFPYAVKVSESAGIRVRNLHVDSNSKVSFDDAVFDATNHAEVRAREFAALDMPAAPIAAGPRNSAIPVSAAPVLKLAGGFYSISGGAVDASGTLYFVDTHWQRIYKWDARAREAVIISSDPLQPENLAIDKKGDLLVVSRSGAGKVYTLRPDDSVGAISVIQQQPAKDSAAKEYLPTSVYELRQFSRDRASQYCAPGGTICISAGDEFVQGHTEWGTKMADLLRSFGLEAAVSGKPVYLTTENDEQTFKGTLTPSGSITDLKLFAETGGESAVQDGRGRVYVAAGQILVYSPEGKLLERIDVPERPIDLVFGGLDRKTLYILTHHSLYAVSQP
jgi:sugar lactone lactonase YvrE